jgi:hypothetical protein
MHLFSRQVQRGLQQAARQGQPQHPTRRLVQGREVRHRVEPDGVGQIGRVAQQRRDLAVVATHELLEHQHREQLMLRELARAEAVCVHWQRRLLRHGKSGQQHLPWRLAGLVHPSSCSDQATRAQPNKRRTC